MSRRAWINLLSVVAATVIVGCDAHDMADQDRYEPHEASPVFEDGTVSRPLLAGVVARDDVVEEHTGDNYPFALSESDLVRGQQRFEIFCAPCHGRLGDGNGMIVQRGFPRPPSFYLIPGQQQTRPDLHARTQVLINQTPRHIYNVITNGYGAMYSYNDRVEPDDRWRIAGYIKALQLSAPGAIAPTTQRSPGSGNETPSGAPGSPQLNTSGSH